MTHQNPKAKGTLESRVGEIMPKIAALFDIEIPIQLIALAENNEKDLFDLLLKAGTKFQREKEAANAELRTLCLALAERIRCYVKEDFVEVGAETKALLAKAAALKLT